MQTATQQLDHYNEAMISVLSSSCLPCGSSHAGNGRIGDFVEATSDSQRLAEETIAICTSTQEKSRSVMNFADETRGALCDLDTAKGGTGKMSVLSPSKFMTIVKMLDNDDKRNEVMDMVMGMDELAVTCSSKAVEMESAMQRGIDSIPKNNKNEPTSTDTRGINGEDDTDYEEDEIDFESDITELQECTEGLRSMNIFSAAQKGTRAFDSLGKKTEVFQLLFQRIKELCVSVARLSQTLMVDGCCAQLKASIHSLKELIRCMRLTKIIQKLADAGRRMVEAFLDLVKVAWEKFANFVEELGAVRKMKAWVKGLNPLNPESGVFGKGGTDLYEKISKHGPPSLSSCLG